MKRLFDVIMSLLILSIFLPFGVLIALAIVLESKGGVFYKQERIGLKGKTFYLLKFRTMRPNADQVGQLTVGMRDPRITQVGYYLRKVKLDEFPQFLNVLRGEMSIVGPRPEVKEFVDLYNDEQRKVLEVKPGITDYASLHYFDENKLLGESENPRQTYIDEIMPAKLEWNKRYVADAGIATDIRIMWQTFLRMIK